MVFNKSYLILLFLFFLSVVFLAACGNAGASQPTATSANLFGEEDGPPPPPLDPQRVAQGQELYAEYCAECHGANGEGQPDWKTPNEDGSFKPPPHDNGGHTWHHDDDLLLDIIANGSDFPQTQMPTFGDKLSDEEILAIIDYMKSWWGPEERAFQWQVTWQARQQK
jgi:mono/diheme cytochrome c family protein